MEKYFDLFYKCNGVSTDSRKIEKDCLFVALSGNNFNGNIFASVALDNGAKFSIVDNIEYADNVKIFYVDNSLIFLQKLANYHRNKFDIPLIAITGTNGKTTTKELISLVLSKKYNTLSTIGNLNNHIGVPLTLLRLNEKHEIAVIEMGANKHGDISELCEIANPNFGIITNIGKAHLEGFESFQGVINTKTELYKYLDRNKGLIFYNSDDQILTENIPKKIQYFTYGTNVNNSNIFGEYIESLDFVKLTWKSINYKSGILQTNIIGKYNFFNLLSAICIGNYFNINSLDINDAICAYIPQNNRSQLIKKENYNIILDAYNANPSSMISSLESFLNNPAKEKIAFLGDMFELGNFAKEEHLKIVTWCIENNIKTCFVGKEFYDVRNLSENLLFFKYKNEIIEYLKLNKIKTDLILIKASRGIGLEDLINYL